MSENFNPFTLKDKNILVTGSSSGIGREIAMVCSRMGATVILTGRNEHRLQEVMNLLEGTDHKYVVADLADPSQIGKLVEECPQLDGVVHSAGIGDRTLLKQVRKEDVERVMAVNFTAPVLLQKSLLKDKKVKKGASIVFIASMGARVPTMGIGLYSASKGALLSYAKVLGLELAPRMIRVNSICPAMVWTEFIEKDAEVMGVDYREIEKGYPLKRYGRPEDVAYLAVYLLSDAASWMTGSAIDITGGGCFSLNGVI